MKHASYSLLVGLSVLAIHILSTFASWHLFKDDSNRDFPALTVLLLILFWLYWILSHLYLRFLNDRDSRLQAYTKSIFTILAGYSVIAIPSSFTPDLSISPEFPVIQLYILLPLLPLVPTLAELGLWAKKRIVNGGPPKKPLFSKYIFYAYRALLLGLGVVHIHIATVYILGFILSLLGIGNNNATSGYYRLNFIAAWAFLAVLFLWVYWGASYIYLWILKQEDGRLGAYIKSFLITVIGYLTANIPRLKHNEWDEVFTPILVLVFLLPLTPILAELGLWIKKRMAGKTA